ncbi:MAG: hypothetical protein DRP08_04720 [Candidatus Aenigmatarchaeota archaeon]|nr:MAG: hypothetical protein DRP08_04720 [Candidatus Aenigmarchaeota archaeon]
MNRRGRSKNVIKELLNRLAYPIGTVMFHALSSKLGKDPLQVIVESPRDVYDALLEIMENDEERVRWLISQIVTLISPVVGYSASVSEIIENMINDNAEYFRTHLSKLERSLNIKA